MSIKHSGPWHYEYIAGREKGHQWRVADADDDVIRDFASEAEAQEFVRKNNADLAPPQNPNWRY